MGVYFFELRAEKNGLNQEIIAANVINKRCVCVCMRVCACVYVCVEEAEGEGREREYHMYLHNQEGKSIEKWTEYMCSHFTEEKTQLVNECVKRCSISEMFM